MKDRIGDDCKYMEREDISEFGSDVFDHPTYKFYCCRREYKVELLSSYCVNVCEYCTLKDSRKNEKIADGTD